MNARNESHEALSAENLTRLLDRGLSTRARFGHVLLLLAATAMSIVVASLLATEPDLPNRTIVAFAVLLGIGLAWISYSVWVLRNRWTLLAGHRVAAGIMAVVFSGVFTAGAVWIGLTTGMAAVWLAAATGGILMVASSAILVRAHDLRLRLQARRKELERHLDKP